MKRLIFILSSVQLYIVSAEHYMTSHSPASCDGIILPDDTCLSESYDSSKIPIITHENDYHIVFPGLYSGKQCNTAIPSAKIRVNITSKGHHKHIPLNHAYFGNVVMNIIDTQCKELLCTYELISDECIPVDEDCTIRSLDTLDVSFGKIFSDHEFHMILPDHVVECDSRHLKKTSSPLNRTIRDNLQLKVFSDDLIPFEIHNDVTAIVDGVWVRRGSYERYFDREHFLQSIYQQRSPWIQDIGFCPSMCDNYQRNLDHTAKRHSSWIRHYCSPGTFVFNPDNWMSQTVDPNLSVTLFGRTWNNSDDVSVEPVVDCSTTNHMGHFRADYEIVIVDRVNDSQTYIINSLTMISIIIIICLLCFLPLVKVQVYQFQ